MTITSCKYNPDYAVPPGWVLEEHIEAENMSQAEFARRCDRSPKLISDIISGKAAIHPKTALQFQKVLGLDARIWLGIDADYRLHLERELEHISQQTKSAPRVECGLRGGERISLYYV